jgi:hypothetical protein
LFFIPPVFSAPKFFSKKTGKEFISLPFCYPLVPADKDLKVLVCNVVISSITIEDSINPVYCQAKNASPPPRQGLSGHAVSFFISAFLPSGGMLYFRS